MSIDMGQLAARLILSDIEWTPALIKLIDERIELALGRLRVESIDSYRNGFDRVPEPSHVVPDLVDGAGVRRRADPSANLGDEVGQLTHDLAPSVGPEGSVGGSSASTVPSGTDVGEPSGERS